MPPPSFAGLLAAPAFVVNMDACADRWAAVRPRLEAAGFGDLRRWPGVDARKGEELQAAWAAVGWPRFDASDAEFVSYPGKQGCLLSHVALWRHILEAGLPVAVIFEDDVEFHARWAELAPKYYAATPTDWDALYLGSQIDYFGGVPSHIMRTPVFCTHAYAVTAAGARRLLSTVLDSPRGVRTIDCMLIDAMKASVYFNTACPFQWYAWNGTLAPDPAATRDAKWAKRNSGLVFQDAAMGSFVRPW